MGIVSLGEEMEEMIGRVPYCLNCGILVIEHTSFK